MVSISRDSYAVVKLLSHRFGVSPRQFMDMLIRSHANMTGNDYAKMIGEADAGIERFMRENGDSARAIIVGNRDRAGKTSEQEFDGELDEQITEVIKLIGESEEAE